MTRIHALLGSLVIVVAAACTDASLATGPRVPRSQWLHDSTRGVPSAVELTDLIATPISIDNGVTVNPNNGVAVVTGTLSCTAPTSVTLHVELTQSQKHGKATSVAQATVETTIDCTGPKAWAMSLAPPTGGFESGSAMVTATTVNVGPLVEPATVTRTVKMSWGHK
jgi:hypothetical protein